MILLLSMILEYCMGSIFLFNADEDAGRFASPLPPRLCCYSRREVTGRVPFIRVCLLVGSVELG